MTGEDTAPPKAPERLVTLPHARRVEMIVRWPQADSPAHCLVRLHVPEAPGKPVAVVSEIRSNPDEFAFSEDFPALADAVVRRLDPTLGVQPADIVWIAHHGAFSYYDARGAPETFTLVALEWDGRYHGDLTGHQRLRPDDAARYLHNIGLPSVGDSLVALDWRSGPPMLRPRCAPS